MSDIELLIYQTEDSYNWTHQLLKTVPLENWDFMPEVIQTTLNWQVGHLIVSHYFHSIMVIKGHQMDILQKIPMKEYDSYFTNGSPEMTIGQFASQTLLEHLDLIQKNSIKILKFLTPEDLGQPLEPSPVPHPIAKTKLEALDWNIKHTMYHCGQIGILKRIVAERHDFGLKKRAKMKYILLFLLLLVGCRIASAQSISDLNLQLEKMYRTGSLIEHLFDTNTILMAEYQPSVYGDSAIKTYTDSLFYYNVFADVKFNTLEIFDYGDLIIDIGKLEWSRNSRKESGKYWNIWKKGENNRLVLQNHSFGFNHKVNDANLFRFYIKNDTRSRIKSNTNFELLAYNSLMEKAVKTRNGILRTDFFTDDAIFYPFEESPKITKSALLPYMIQYNSGDVKIHDIEVYSIDYHDLKDGYLEYNEFQVKWQFGDYQGATAGKGIRIWKRQKDGSIKIYREIGLHNL